MATEMSDQSQCNCLMSAVVREVLDRAIKNDSCDLGRLFVEWRGVQCERQELLRDIEKLEEQSKSLIEERDHICVCRLRKLCEGTYGNNSRI